MWNRGAGAAPPRRHTPQASVWTMFRLRPWPPPPPSAASLWWAQKMTSHRGHAAAATLPRLISTWTHLHPWPSGAQCPAPWPRPLSPWTLRSTLVSSLQTQGLRAALPSWHRPPRLTHTHALSAEEATSWREQWPSSVAQGAAAACRALTHPAGTEVCTAQPMPAVIMTQKWRTRTWRGNYRDSGRSK